MIQIPMMKHQQEFCADFSTRFLALIGGFGCGKTKAFCYKTIIMAALNAGYEGAIAEPTNYLTKTHLIPNFITALEECKIPYDFEKSTSIFHLHFREGSTKIYCLSGENYERLVGYNLAFFGSDETDTSSHEVAKEMWNKAISRCRWGRYRQIYSTSTPEGYKFLHEFFETNKYDEHGMLREDRRAIHASTYDNPLIPRDYIETMRENYTEAQWKIWALGQFGNLHTRLVYEEFDRVLNHSDLTLEQLPKNTPLHIGMDFNIDHCAAIVHVIHQGNPVAVKEFVDIKDVPTMCAILRKEYAGRQVFVYPDASGKNRDATGRSSSHAILKDAGFTLRVNTVNPAIGDRVNSMNAMFCNSLQQRRYKVNTKYCPTYTKCLERQSWVKDMPDKTNNVDHPLDAGGYFIYFNYPIQGKPTIRQR